MIQRNAISHRVRQYILAQFPLASEQSLDQQTLLIEEGIVDSIGVLDIVSFLEDEFQIEIAEDDIDPEHFSSIEALSAFVQDQVRQHRNASREDSP